MRLTLGLHHGGRNPPGNFVRIEAARPGVRVLGPPLVLLLTAGCIGSSSPSSDSSVVDGKVWTQTANLPSGVDQATEKTLVSEWAAARFACGQASGCPSREGAFSTGKALLSAMRRMNPSVPVADNLNATMSLANPVFVLRDSTSNRLHIAVADADGRYVHLVAVGTGQPRLRVAALGPLSQWVRVFRGLPGLRTRGQDRPAGRRQLPAALTSSGYTSADHEVEVSAARAWYAQVGSPQRHRRSVGSTVRFLRWAVLGSNQRPWD